MKKLLIKAKSQIRRKKSIRKKISGTDVKPRISVFRSNNHIYVQAIDDISAKTLAAGSDKDIKDKGKPVEVAEKLGELIGSKLKESKIESAVFDRSGYKYHGKVKAIAEGIRKSGLKV
jgi:large subunit ribosomal protein L18